MKTLSRGEKQLSALLTAVVTEAAARQEDGNRHIWYIPRPAEWPLEQPEGDDHDYQELRLHGSAALRYRDCLVALNNDPYLEHLNAREIDRELGAFVWQGWLTRQEHQQPQRRRVVVREFLSGIAKPHEDFDVLFSIIGLNLAEETTSVGDVTFSRLDQATAESWGVTGSPTDQKIPVELVGKTVAYVRVQAGHPQKAAKRAEEAIDTALNLLRICARHLPLPRLDQELLQRRGEGYLVRSSASETGINWGWRRSFSSIDLTLRGKDLATTQAFYARLKPIYDGTIPPKLATPFSRAIEWMGTSITRERHDDRVIDLCTALECLLTTKGDRFKGDAIALRSMLLGHAVGGTVRHPADLYLLYDLRSQVVHGSARGVCGESDYRTLWRMVRDVLLNAIAFTTRNPSVTRPSRLIRALEQQDRLEEAIQWLDHDTNPHSPRFCDFARKRLGARDDNAGPGVDG